MYVHWCVSRQWNSLWRSRSTSLSLSFFCVREREREGWALFRKNRVSDRSFSPETTHRAPGNLRLFFSGRGWEAFRRENGSGPRWSTADFMEFGWVTTHFIFLFLERFLYSIIRNLFSVVAFGGNLLWGAGGAQPHIRTSATPYSFYVAHLWMHVGIHIHKHLLNTFIRVQLRVATNGG